MPYPFENGVGHLTKDAIVDCMEGYIEAYVQRKLDAATDTAERERKRADFAEIALMRTQMRLAVERARARIDEPWSVSAIRTQRDEVAEVAGPEALAAAAEPVLRRELERLTLLVADVLWNPPTDPAADREALFATLRAAGHPLVADGDRRFGPSDEAGVGLHLAMGPLALRLTLVRADGRRHAVTIGDEAPMRYDVRDAPRAG